MAKEKELDEVGIEELKEWFGEDFDVESNSDNTVEEEKEDLDIESEDETINKSQNSSNGSDDDNDNDNEVKLENKDNENDLSKKETQPPKVVKTIINRLVDSGTWEDVSIKIGETQYNNLEELIESEDLTQELLDDLVEQQKSIQAEKLKSSYLKIDNPDDVRVKVAEAVLKGEKYEEIVENNNIIEEVRKLDLTDKNNAVSLIGFYYDKYANYDMEDPDVIELLRNKITRLDKEGDLITVAEELRKNINDNFQKEVQQQLEEEKRKKELRKQTLSQKKKELKDRLKTENYSDSFINKAVKLRFSKEGNKKLYLSELESKIEEDPEFEKNLLHFMLDPEDFIEKKNVKTKLDTQRRMIEIGKPITAGSGRKTKEESYDSDLPPDLKDLFE